MFPGVSGHNSVNSGPNQTAGHSAGPGHSLSCHTSPVSGHWSQISGHNSKHWSQVLDTSGHTSKHWSQLGDTGHSVGPGHWSPVETGHTRHWSSSADRRQTRSHLDQVIL